MHDIEIEQGLIGTILDRNDLFPLVTDVVSSVDFFEPIHGQVWEIITAMIGAGKLANVLTIRPFLPADMKIAEGMTLQQYLARLAAAACTPSELPHFAVTIRDLSHRRQIAAIGGELSGASAPEPGKLAEWGVDELDRIATARSSKATPAVSMGESAARTLDAIASAYQRGGVMTGMTYGLRDLDIKTGGLHKGELTILAGRPGMMKTGLALSFARNLSEAGHRGIFFSLEMKDTQLTRRILSDMVFEKKEIPHFLLRSGNIRESDFTLIRDASMTLDKWPLQIEQDDVTVSQILSRARQRKRRYGLDYIIVDHIGHVQVSDRYRGNKNLEITEISGALMRGARELDIGVLVLCQLNRAVESRDNKRPTLADLRESGAIEQDASTVMFVYREAYYLMNQEPATGSAEYQLWQDRMAVCVNNLDIILGKQRDGGTGTVQAFVDVRCNAVREKGWTRDMFANTGEEFAF